MTKKQLREKAREICAPPVYGHEVCAIVREWNGGRHGSPGEFVAIVRPRLGKNGTPLKTEPLIVKKLDEIKKGYKYGSYKKYTIKEYIV